MKRFLMLAALLALAAGAADAKSCKDPTTHKFIKCPAASSSGPAMSSTKPAKNCVKGKLCGNTCIAKTDVCHK
jgi:hypothetical protein